MSFIWNRFRIGPNTGDELGLSGGGYLLLSPGQSPGAMNLAQLQAKIWHLLRVNGPANGFPVPSDPGSDFPPSLLQADLNVALAQFISDSGLEPGISDHMDTLPVFSVLDMPVPPSLISLRKIEYNVVGGLTYALSGLSLGDFDEACGSVFNPSSTGQPWCYREIIAGQVRFWPPPGPGQAVSSGVGYVTIEGVVTAGDMFTVTLVDGSITATVAYGAVPGDTPITVVPALMNLINASPASAFLQSSISTFASNQVSLFAPNLDPVTYHASTTSTTATISPTAVTTVTPVGDTMTWYYSSSGAVLSLPGDTPGIPDIFHSALVYRCLSDYWDRKEDPGQSDRYMKKYFLAVKQAKAFNSNVNRESQPSIGNFENAGYAWSLGQGWW